MPTLAILSVMICDAREFIIEKEDPIAFSWQPDIFKSAKAMRIDWR
jgi:hypothetical protein